MPRRPCSATSESSAAGAVGVLERHDAEAVEPAVAFGDPPRDPRVHLARVRLARRAVGPVAEQLGHRREHLALDALRVHRLGPPFQVPRQRRDRPEMGRAVVDLGAVALHLDARPTLARERAERELRRDDVRVDVDHAGRPPAAAAAATGANVAKTLLELKIDVSTISDHSADAPVASIAPASTNQLRSSCCPARSTSSSVVARHAAQSPATSASYRRRSAGVSGRSR